MTDQKTDTIKRVKVPELDDIFNLAKHKFKSRNNKPGNTTTPWRDFNAEHLESRLKEEIAEWKESGNPQELLDIINCAAFLYRRQLFKDGKYIGPETP